MSNAYTREWALAISDELVKVGVSHVIGVSTNPPRRYRVGVEPRSNYPVESIVRLQTIAEMFDGGISYAGGAFMFEGPVSEGEALR